MRNVRAAVRLALLATVLAFLYPLLLLARGVQLFAPRQGARMRTALTVAWARASLWLMGVRLSLDGRPEPGAYLAVGNHLSWLDILVLISVLEARFVSKAEVARWPLIGHLATTAGTLYLDRERKRDLKRAGSELSEALRAGERVIVFPEGTSTRGAEVLPFRPSLFQVAVEHEVPVRTFALHYATEPHDPPAHLAVCWWGDMEFASHFLGFLRLGRVRAHVHLPHEAPTGADRKALALSAEASVRGGFRPSIVH